MKKSLIIILLIYIFLPLSSQERDKITLNNVWAFGVGKMELYDSYLSPALYSGLAYTWDATHSAFYRCSNQRVSWRNHNHIGYSSTLNPAFSSAMDYLELSIGYGSYYHFRPAKGLIFRVGGELDLEGGIKYMARNINNIASADIAINLSIGGAARYVLNFKNFSLGFEYEISTPAIGCMFVPQMGQSYYEIYLNMSSTLRHVVHFSSFNNKRGLDSNLMIDLMFNGFTLRLGGKYEYLEWHANNLYFSRRLMNGYIGTVVDLHLFGGTQSRNRSSMSYL